MIPQVTALSGMEEEEAGRVAAQPGATRFAPRAGQAVSAHSGDAPSRMSDQELADACCPGETADEQAAFIAALSADHRAILERLIWTGNELNAGRVPPGVMI